MGEPVALEHGAAGSSCIGPSARIRRRSSASPRRLRVGPQLQHDPAAVDGRGRHPGAAARRLDEQLAHRPPPARTASEMQRDSSGVPGPAAADQPAVARGPSSGSAPSSRSAAGCRRSAGLAVEYDDTRRQMLEHVLGGGAMGAGE